VLETILKKNTEATEKHTEVLIALSQNISALTQALGGATLPTPVVDAEIVDAEIVEAPVEAAAPIAPAVPPAPVAPAVPAPPQVAAPMPIPPGAAAATGMPTAVPMPPAAPIAAPVAAAPPVVPTTPAAAPAAVAPPPVPATNLPDQELATLVIEASDITGNPLYTNDMLGRYEIKKLSESTPEQVAAMVAETKQLIQSYGSVV